MYWYSSARLIDAVRAAARILDPDLPWDWTWGATASTGAAAAPAAVWAARTLAARIWALVGLAESEPPLRRPARPWLVDLGPDPDFGTLTICPQR